MTGVNLLDIGIFYGIYRNAIAYMELNGNVSWD
jgi:hypothetical protein